MLGEAWPETRSTVSAPFRHSDEGENQFATLEYIDWFNNHRLHGEIGYVPPAELEEVFYASEIAEEIKG